MILAAGMLEYALLAALLVLAAYVALHRMDKKIAKDYNQIGKIDIVLLRNVLIYFDLDIKRQVLARAVRQMAPDGFIMLGTAESPTGLCDSLEPVLAEGSVFYRVKRG